MDDVRGLHHYIFVCDGEGVIDIRHCRDRFRVLIFFFFALFLGSVERERRFGGLIESIDEAEEKAMVFLAVTFLREEEIFLFFIFDGLDLEVEERMIAACLNRVLFGEKPKPDYYALYGDF